MTNKQTIDGVSRELLESFSTYVADSPNAIMRARATELRALLDKPTSAICRGCFTEQSLLEACKTCAEVEAKSAAQPQGEVERLRAELAEQLEIFGVQEQKIDALRAQLAERDVLLGRWELYGQAELKTGVTLARHLVADTLAILSTSAEPKPRGEAVAWSREQFEVWMLGREHPVYGWLDQYWLSRGDDPENYAEPYVQGLWVASQSLYTERLAPVAQSTSSDQYKAELYDEVWQKARDMGFANVIDALEKLSGLKP